MRENNSRHTRVKPIFDKISSNNDWLNSLLKYALNKYNVDPPICGRIIEQYWGDKEKTINAPHEYIDWLICNYNKLNKTSLKSEKTEINETNRLRKDLISGNEFVFRRAKYSISNKKYDNWCLFEGKTNFDIFIETENFFLIAEGKRTEVGRTKNTKWSNERDQMIRNIDCLFSYNPLKPIYAFYILEADKDGNLMNNWSKDISFYKDKNNFEKSLPHRSSIEIEIIYKSYIGFLTWQELMVFFNINPLEILQIN